MPRPRTELHEILCDILESRNVYFAPPVKMFYPCIKYELSRPSIKRADNAVYNNTRCYEVTVIDTDPDSVIRDKVEELPMCSFDRPYVADGLYHYVFTLYY